MSAQNGPLRRNLYRTLNLRAAQGLAATLVLSFVNLAGAFLALSIIGGIKPWTDAQFVGLFGLIEVGLGLGFVFAPNAWRLPVAEANTSDRTSVRLAATTVLIPHWIALAKAVGGVAMLCYAGYVEGVSLATLTVVIQVLLIAVAFLSITVAVARIGVAFPTWDVFFISLRRPGNKPKELPGLTVSGLIIQLFTNVGIFPAVEVLKPGALFGPELAASPGMLAVTAGIAAAAVALSLAAWHGRITWRAPREQQREAEQQITA